MFTIITTVIKLKSYYNNLEHLYYALNIIIPLFNKYILPKIRRRRYTKATTIEPYDIFF